MSGLTTRISRPSTKQHDRIWFEFYKLALADDRLREQIEASLSYYEPWGEVAGVPFDHWWKTHSNLFDELRVREVQKVTESREVIHVAIPLGLDTKRSIEQVRDLLAARQKVEADRRGEGPKRYNRVGAGQFHLTPGMEFRGRTADVVLRVYRDVYLPAGCPPIGAKLAEQVVLFFGSGRLKMKLHFLAASGPEPAHFSQDQLRALRRYIKRAEELVRAAAMGNFPGRSTLIQRVKL